MGFGKPKEDIMTEQDLQDLIKEAKEAGASDAKKVDIASVKVPVRLPELRKDALLPAVHTRASFHETIHR